MAKHESQLIADIDDGYMKVSNLLAEALCCMPLSGAELRVVWFIIRRTYGWVKRGDRSSGKMDLMTAATIADGTCMPKRTVQKCISVLCNKRIINSLQITSNNGMAYGINSRVEEWGNGDIDFANTKAALKDNQDFGTFKNSGEMIPDIQSDYTQNSVEVYANTSIPIRKNEYTSTQISVDQEPVSPVIPRPEGVPKDSIKDSIKDNTTNDSNDSAKAPLLPVEIEKEKPVETQTSSQAHVQFAETVWQLFGQQLPCRRPIVTAAGQFRKRWGDEGICQYLNHLQSTSRKIPDGSDPETFVADTIRTAIRREFEWNGEKRNGSPLRMSLAGAQWPKETEII